MSNKILHEMEGGKFLIVDEGGELEFRAPFDYPDNRNNMPSYFVIYKLIAEVVRLAQENSVQFSKIEVAERELASLSCEACDRMNAFVFECSARYLNKKESEIKALKKVSFAAEVLHAAWSDECEISDADWVRLEKTLVALKGK